MGVCLVLRGWRNRRTAAANYADDKRQDRANRPKEKDARHCSFELAVVSIGRKLLDEKVARKGDHDITGDAAE